MARNQIIDMATSSISDLMKNKPEYRGEARQDMQFLTAQKIGEHEAEIEKIKSVFLAILRDIKNDIDSGTKSKDTAAAGMIQKIKAALPDSRRSRLRWTMWRRLSLPTSDRQSPWTKKQREPFKVW